MCKLRELLKTFLTLMYLKSFCFIMGACLNILHAYCIVTSISSCALLMHWCYKDNLLCECDSANSDFTEKCMETSVFFNFIVVICSWAYFPLFSHHKYCFESRKER
ncbi:hypothetical protein MTO96_032637 [Rhipicephalus appendiculatus]